MVKVCHGHINKVEDGCTYQIVETGITTEHIGTNMSCGLYIKDSECVVCIKIKQLQDLTDLIVREMKGLGLGEAIFAEERRKIASTLYDLVDIKVKEY
jgi:hypothetical protein